MFASLWHLFHWDILGLMALPCVAVAGLGGPEALSPGQRTHPGQMAMQISTDKKYWEIIRNRNE